MNEIKLTEQQKHKMLHALGLEYKKKAYRNYACYYAPEVVWEELVRLGAANLDIVEKGKYYYYHVTKLGAEVLGIELPRDD